MSKIIKTLLALIILSAFTVLALLFYSDRLTPLLDTPSPSITETGETVLNEIIYTYDERIERGNYYANNAFLSLAVNEYTKASQIDPDQPEPYFQLGKSHILLGNFDKATLNLEKVLSLDATHSEANIYLIKNAIKQSNFDKAKAVLQTIQTENAETLYYKALLDLIDQNNEAAATKLNQITKTDNAEIKEKAANLLNAYAEFELFKGGKEIHLKTLIAKSLNQVKEYEISLKLLKEILKEKTDYRDAWILTGYAYLNLEKYDFALDSFRKAYDLDSEKPETQYFLGITYFELNQIEDAITYLNIALKNGFEPQIQIKQKLGDIYLNKKDYNKAIEMYEALLELNSNDVNNFIRPIWIYLEFLNEPDKALELSQKAYKLFPKSAMTYNLIAWSHLGKKEYIKAEENLLTALGIDPNLQAAWYNLGLTYEGMEEKEKALEHYQKAYELGKDSSIGNLAAQAYNNLYNK